jgi:putative flippase GtrA
VRIAVFLGVGAVGFVVQMLSLAALVAAGCSPLTATAAAAAIAVLHNFAWHERLTWADRTRARDGVIKRLSAFAGATGVTSVAGGVVFTAAYERWLGAGVLAANELAIATLAVTNFVIADRWIFSGADRLDGDAGRLESGAKPGREMIRAWRVAVNADGVGLERHE